MTKKSANLQPLWKGMLIFMLTILSACQAGQATPAQPQPTEIAPATATAAPSSTPWPTATNTPLPDLHEGPFVWQGNTRPLLMAHYMPWYQSAKVSGSWGWHWTMDHFKPAQAEDGTWKDLASHYTPLTGPYDSSDVVVLEYQMQLMKLSGIDGVIVDWYGIESFWDYGLINKSTARVFEAAKKAGLKFVICYEDQTIKHMVTNKHLKEEEKIAHGQEVMRYMQETWFSDEAYLKVDDRPVLFTFGPQYFKADDWEALFSALDPKPVFITLDNHVVPAQTASFPWPPMWASQAGVLSHTALASYLTDFYDKAEDWKYRVGGAFPGFHDIYKEAGVGTSYGYLDALDGKTFRFTLQEALAQQPDMVQLITWNDYGEGTIIEPTVEFEYRYLETVLEARKATDPNFSYKAEDLRLPFKLYQLRVKYTDNAEATKQLVIASEALLSGDLDTAKKILAEYP